MFCSFFSSTILPMLVKPSFQIGHGSRTQVLSLTLCRGKVCVRQAVVQFWMSFGISLTSSETENMSLFLQCLFLLPPLVIGTRYQRPCVNQTLLPGL